MSQSSSGEDANSRSNDKIDDVIERDEEIEAGGKSHLRRRAERFNSKKTTRLVTASFAVVCASFIILALRRYAKKRNGGGGGVDKGKKSSTKEVDAEGRPIPQSLIESKRKSLFGTSRYIWHIYRNVAMGLFARTASVMQPISSEITAGPLVAKMDPSNRCTWIIVVYRESCDPCRESLPHFKQECLTLHNRRIAKRDSPDAVNDLVVVGAIEETQLPHDFPVDFFPMYLVMKANDRTRFTKLMLNAGQITSIFAAATGVESSDAVV